MPFCIHLWIANTPFTQTQCVVENMTNMKRICVAIWCIVWLQIRNFHICCGKFRNTTATPKFSWHSSIQIWITFLVCFCMVVKRAHNQFVSASNCHSHWGELSWFSLCISSTILPFHSLLLTIKTIEITNKITITI